MIFSEVSFQFSFLFLNYIYNRYAGAEHYSQKYAGFSDGEINLFWNCLQYQESSVSTKQSLNMSSTAAKRKGVISSPFLMQIGQEVMDFNCGEKDSG